MPQPVISEKQSRARLTNKFRLKVIKYLKVQWKPCFHLSATLKRTK